jgi:hypothetical protein
MSDVLRILKSSPKTRPIASQAIEAAYTRAGMTGCVLMKDTTGGQPARDARDRFRATKGQNAYRSDDALTKLSDSVLTPYGGFDGLYLFTGYAFSQFEQHNAGYPDWLLRFVQDSGCCVGASGVKIAQVLLGIVSRMTDNPYLMAYLVSMWTYLYRTHCGSGWYMGAHAAEGEEHGWCPAVKFDGSKLGRIVLPDFGIDLDEEDEGEYLTSRKWCRGRPPRDLEAWVHDNCRWGEIAEVSDHSAETYIDIAKRGGLVHHGSNTTGGGRPDSTRRIGGHAQPHYGLDFSDQGVEWWGRFGVKVSRSDPAMIEGNQWGSWSGELEPEEWPYGSLANDRVITQADVDAAMRSRDSSRVFDLMASMEGNWGYGPMPEGTWMVRYSTYRRQIAGEEYAYFPQGFRAIPFEDPVPEPVHQPRLVGTLKYDPDRDAFRGVLSQENTGHQYILQRTAQHEFQAVNKTVIS